MKTLTTRPGTWLLFRIWGSIGLQSFGGGASTTYLIYHMFVEKYSWLLPEEYNLFWNLCVMSPGINIIGITILIGRKLGGTRGIFASLAGLLIPSAAITCLLTAGFLGVERFPATQAMLRGVIPATAGIMLVVGIKYAQPLAKELKVEGLAHLGMGLLIPLAAFLAIVLFQIAVPLVLLGAALLGVAMFMRPGAQRAEADLVTPVVAEPKVMEEAHD